MIESPCVKVCTLDARSGLCLGCGRTVDEIALERHERRRAGARDARIAGPQLRARRRRNRMSP